jgi:WD40 repeat protein
MDGSVTLVGFGTGVGSLHASKLTSSHVLKCTRYIKGVIWSPTEPILAAASADGTVIVAKVSNLQDTSHVSVDVLQTLHLAGTPESICFSGDGSKLICFIRDTPYLSYFDLENQFELTKINLNRGSGATVGGFEDHVSFAVMDMAVSPNGKFIALATDTSRNIVIDAVTGKQIRNLYGHTNDAFSNPKIAWSSNGQYIFGNTQEDGSCCVWDVASSTIVKRLDGHLSPIRGLSSSRLSDTLVTTSFDKQTKVWLMPM